MQLSTNPKSKTQNPKPKIQNRNDFIEIKELEKGERYFK
jgi:hypothetical protein